MTQPNRWLTALALLVAFAACTVRAEEEQVEALPAPHQVAALPPALSAPAFPLLFAPPCPLPVPMPIPAAMYGLPTGPVCLPYPCPVGCGPAAVDAPRYVVAAHMVKGDGDDAKVTMCPRVTVPEGQAATIHLQGYETAQDRSSLQMTVSVMRQPKGARLAMAVTEASGGESNSAGYAHSHSETTSVQCNAPFGTPCVMELSDGARMVVTVTEAEREQHTSRAACGCGGDSCCAAKAQAAEACEASPLDAVGEVVGCLYDALSDTATGALGWVFGTDEDDTEPAPQAYLQTPPQFMAPVGVCPPVRQASAPEQPKTCPSCHAASCPKADCSCVQCAATEAAPKPTVRIRIDAKTSRTRVEIRGKDKCWKASADNVTVTNGRLILESDVHIESDDGSTEFSADKMVRDLDGLEIRVGD